MYNYRQITVIIPFLNEGVEVYNTVESVRNTSENVSIILLNDASTDDYDYRLIAKEFDTEYVEHSIRIGVAASRDLGINMCKTDYFLLLDGHMRFHNSDWQRRIIDTLDKNDRVLLCCQTSGFIFRNGKYVERPLSPTPYGAFINFDNVKLTLEPSWVTRFDENGDIPCVLGAAYAGSKKYWTYLKGLSGLHQYGCDESYISIKVWLEGGRCILLDDVIVSHLYRDSAPYNVSIVSRIYNKLLIVYLLCPVQYRKMIEMNIRDLSQGDILSASYKLLYENYEMINTLKTYYDGIFTKPFCSFFSYNYRFTAPVSDDHDIDLIANKIKREVVNMSDIGLFFGKMGISIFLFHYAKETGIEEYQIIAEKLIDDIWSNINYELPEGLARGFAGIGWGILYLIDKKFVDSDPDAILCEVDSRIMEKDPLRISDLSYHVGFAGILQYIYCRLINSSKSFKEEQPFDRRYLKDVYDKVCSVINSSEFNSLDDGYIYIKYYNYFNGKHFDEELCIYDIIYPTVPYRNLNDMPIGLVNGVAGEGLDKLLRKA